jgi:hypothetical protein
VSLSQRGEFTLNGAGASIGSFTGIRKSEILGGGKSEIRISKSETNPKSKEEKRREKRLGFGFSSFGFRISDILPQDLFRISDFGFRIY